MQNIASLHAMLTRVLRAAVRAAVGLPSVAEQMELALENQKRAGANGGGLMGLMGMYQKGAEAAGKQVAAENASVAPVPIAAKSAPAPSSGPMASSALSRASRKRR